MAKTWNASRHFSSHIFWDKYIHVILLTTQAIAVLMPRFGSWKVALHPSAVGYMYEEVFASSK